MNSSTLLRSTRTVNKPSKLEILLSVLRTAKETETIIEQNATNMACTGTHAIPVLSDGTHVVRRCCDSRDCVYKIVEYNGQYCVAERNNSAIKLEYPIV
jgi:hypothetical protein